MPATSLGGGASRLTGRLRVATDEELSFWESAIANMAETSQSGVRRMSVGGGRRRFCGVGGGECGVVSSSTAGVGRPCNPNTRLGADRGALPITMVGSRLHTRAYGWGHLVVTY